MQRGNLGIANKIFIVLLLLSIVSIITAGIIAGVVGTNFVQSETDMMIESNMQLARKNIEEYFEMYERVIMTIYSQNLYAEYLEVLNVWDIKNYAIIKSKLEENLQDIAYIYNDIMAIGVITKRQDVIKYDAKSLSSTNSYYFDDDIIEWKALALETLEDNRTLYSNAVTISGENKVKEDVVYLAHRLTNIDNYSKGTVGSLIICIAEERLRDTYVFEGNVEEQLSFICNDDGQIISCSDTKFNGSSIDLTINTDIDLNLLKESIILNDMTDIENIKLYTKRIGDTGFYLVNVQNYNNQIKGVYSILSLIILLGIIMSLICVVVSLRFSDSIHKSVEMIIIAMNHVYKGNYSIKIETQRRDEFGQISNHFNYMVTKVKESIIQEKEALTKAKNAEIQILEAQINPHFLYNTLEAINWMAIDKGEVQISQMLQELAGILRYGINKSNIMVTIEDELNYLEKYIHLQQERLEYSFQYYIHVDVTILSSKIHKLLLQPIVENAIIHGFPGNGDTDYIDINISKEKNHFININIKDTGRGMDSQIYQKFNSYNKNNQTIENSIGISNVILRLQYYYDNKGEFKISSSKDGTCVMMQIPIQ
ncbi:MAG: histidine kinase [Eubacteriales bacterium]